MNSQSQNTLQKEPKLLIRLMGEPKIFLGEKEPLQFQYRKSIALLVYLVVSQRAYSREYLADLFWRHMTEKNAHAGLRKVVADINKAIPQLLIVENHKIGLSKLIPIDIDVTNLEKLTISLRQKPVAEISDIESKQAGHFLSCYQEPFMSGFSVQNAPDFDNWIVVQQQYFHKLVVEALFTLSEYASQADQIHSAVDYMRRLLEIDPANEEAHYRLISLYEVDGQHALALNQYEVCKQVLFDAYGSFPGREIVDLYNRITFDSKRKKVKRNLPLPTTTIYGREDDIHNVIARLKQDQCRILTVLGPGGIGKTHLSLMVGNEINQHEESFFEDGVIFVSLQAINSIHSLSSSIAHQLGYSYEKESDPVEQLCKFLAPYKMVLVLDNFEQLVISLQDFQEKQYDLIQRILQSAPGLRLLITSRIRLNFQGEFVYPLHGISFPENNGKGTALARNYPAVSLFIERAEQLSGQYTPDETELQAIIEICQSVNGLPLGILLAAGWSNLLTAREIAEMIKNKMENKGLAFLATGGPDMPERHRDMDSVFRQSWDMISVKQRETLAALSLLPSSFSIEIAREVANADLPDLKVLLDHSLLERKSSGRLQMHDLLRLYASTQGGDISKVFERTCKYYAAKLQQWEKDLQNDRQIRAINEMNLEIDNLRAIWDETLSNGKILYASKMFEGLCQYYAWHHYYGEAANFCENLILKLEEERTYDKAFSIQDAYRLKARALTWKASFVPLDEAGVYLTRSMEILDDPLLKECDIRKERAFSCYWMAVTISQTGKYDEAMQLYETSKALYESLQDDWHVKDLYLSNGVMLWDKSRYSDGKKMVEESLAISRRIGDRIGIAHALLWLGNIVLFMGYHKGEKMVRESLSIISELGDRKGSRSGVIQACSSLYILGMYDEACELMREHINQDKYDFRRDSSNTVLAIGLIHTGNYEEARTYVENGVYYGRELGDAYGENLALITQAWFAIFETDYKKAETILTESMQNSRKHEVNELESWSYSFLVITWMIMGENEKGIEELHKAFALADSINSYTSKVFVLAGISLWLIINGKKDLGVTAYKYVWQFPVISNSAWWNDYVGAKIEELAGSLFYDDNETALTDFSDVDLDKVISNLLCEAEIS